MAKYADEIADMHPRSWLSKYRKTSPLYLLKMGLFYVALGNALGIAVNLVLPYSIPGYHEPHLSIPIISGVFAGTSEETFFYGIPFYLSGNPYIVLLTGIAWSSIHILNTNVLQFKDLAYANYLGTVPWIFFTLRVWISGKGWFAIIFHSAYDVVALSGNCVLGQNTCSLTGSYSSLVIVGGTISSAILMVITYSLYKWRTKRELNKQKISSIIETKRSRKKFSLKILSLGIFTFVAGFGLAIFEIGFTYYNGTLLVPMSNPAYHNMLFMTGIGFLVGIIGFILLISGIVIFIRNRKEPILS